MKKKKYLIGLALAALSMTTLVACGDVTIVNNGDKTDTPVQENDEITINVENKKYDGEPISVSATAKSKTEVTLEYKLASADDSEYTTDEPIEIGKYIVKASSKGNSKYIKTTVTKEFSITTEDVVTLTVENKIYDGNEIEATASSTSGQAPTIEFKAKGADDSTYTTTKPKEIGEYVAKAKTNDSMPYTSSYITKEFKIKKENQIVISVENKLYNGGPIESSATITNGTPVIEYKLQKEDDSAYSTTKPTQVGRYVARVKTAETDEFFANEKTKEFKITTDFLEDDYKQYENTSAYVKVTNEKEFLDALYNARTTYTNTMTGITENDGYIVRNNVRKNEANWKSAITKGLYLKEGNNYVQIDPNTAWDPDDTTYTKDMTYYEDSPYSKVTYTQELTKASEIKVIEIAADLDLGYNKIKDLGAASVFENWDNKKRLEGATNIYCDPDIQAAGISKIKVENITDLLIYSKNGSKITHAGFAVSSCKDVEFRNLEMDEIWMWEDSTTNDLSKIGDYDSFGWAYFKVSFSENITIDHCTFGKSFDGQIDYSNPCYQTIGTYQKAPYQATGANKLTVSNCDFLAGSDDKDGYIYKMMERIENEYQVYLKDKKKYTNSTKTCRYYFAKRDSGLSFEDILYAYAIPQKKAFLWGDSGDSYKYNKYLNAVLCNCYIRNIEDRLPKVRGGMAYVYNVLVDNTEYYPYAVKYGNVSQGILAGLDASVYLESVEYKGIKQYLKNNDSANSNYPTVTGGYMIKNSIIGDKQGSSTDTTNPFEELVTDTSKLSTEYFAFKVNGEKTDLTEPPFTIDAFDLSTGSLYDYLTSIYTGAI